MIPGTLELALTAIVIGAIGIFSPTRLALSAMMLTSETHAWGRAIAYLVGSTAVFAAAAFVGLLGVEAAGLRGVAPTVNIVLGSVMIGVAVAMLVARRRQRDLPPRPSRHPCSLRPGSAPRSPSSRSDASSSCWPGNRIGDLARGGVPALGWVGVMIAIWQVPVWSPMLLYVFGRDRFDALAQRAQPALDRIEEGIVGAIVVGLVGGWILVQGLTG